MKDKIENFIIQRKQLVELLNEENKKNFSEIYTYVCSLNLKEHKREEALLDILGIMLKIQEENKSFNKIIGGDIKEFCNSIIKSSNNEKKLFKKGKNFFDIVTQCFFIMLSIYTLIDYIPLLIEKHKIVNFNLTVAFLVQTLILIGFYLTIFRYIENKGFDKKNKKIIISIIFIIFLGILFMIWIWIKYDKYILMTISGHLVLILICGFWLIEIINLLISRAKIKNMKK